VQSSYHYGIIVTYKRSLLMELKKLHALKKKIYANFTKEESTLSELLLRGICGEIQANVETSVISKTSIV